MRAVRSILGNFQIHSTVLLAVVTVLDILRTHLVYNWKFVLLTTFIHFTHPRLLPLLTLFFQHLNRPFMSLVPLNTA